MTEVRTNRNREIAILLGILLTMILYFLIPATCPGFPRPVTTRVFYSNVTTHDDECVFSIDGRVTNEGTRGYVIVTAELVNVTNRTPLVNSSLTVFMLQGEEKSVRIQLTGRAQEPYRINLKARRK